MFKLKLKEFRPDDFVNVNIVHVVMSSGVQKGNVERSIWINIWLTNEQLSASRSIPDIGYLTHARRLFFTSILLAIQ